MIKTMIAVPCMDMVHTDFLKSCLGLIPVDYTEFFICPGSLVYDARNQLAQKAIEKGFNRVLWLDSDMVFSPDLLIRMNECMKESGSRFVSGLYFRRKNPHNPVIYKAVEAREIRPGMFQPVAEPYLDYPRERMFEIAGCGFGAVLMETDVLRKVGEKYGLPFSPLMGFGEDLSFCRRAAEIGEKMYCNSTIKLGHIGKYEIWEDTFSEGRNNNVK